MKTRSGFVANSSSSSFIVAVDKSKRSRVTITLSYNVDLSRYGEVVTYEDELNKVDYFSDLGWELENYPDGELIREYNRAKVALASDKVVIIGHFDDDTGDEIECALCKSGLPESDQYDIIYNEAGY